MYPVKMLQNHQLTRYATMCEPIHIIYHYICMYVHVYVCMYVCMLMHVYIKP